MEDSSSSGSRKRIFKKKSVTPIKQRKFEYEEEDVVALDDVVVVVAVAVVSVVSVVVDVVAARVGLASTPEELGFGPITERGCKWTGCTGTGTVYLASCALTKA